jgi:1-deoxy-D-xylulose-5-phosphate synthase
MAPRDENELQHMLSSALEYGHPVAVRFPKGEVTGIAMDKEFKAAPLGKGELLRQGEDLLLAYGRMAYPALEAARVLEAEGIRLAVFDAKFAKPLDEEAILAFAGSGRTIITVEEGVVAGGFGGEVRELLDAKGFFSVRFKSIGLPREIYPLGKAAQIRKNLRLDPAGLAAQIREFYRRG